MGENQIFGQNLSEKWCYYPGVVGQKKGRGYSPKRVVPGKRAVLVLPCPPDSTVTSCYHLSNKLFYHLYFTFSYSAGLVCSYLVFLNSWYQRDAWIESHSWCLSGYEELPQNSLCSEPVRPPRSQLLHTNLRRLRSPR